MARKTPKNQPKSDKNLVALAGEYHVLAELAERGIVGALTLGHTKGIDILAHNTRTDALKRVEVKTTGKAPRKATLWHPGVEKVHSWPMAEKHGNLTDPDLIFCFVHLEGPGCAPRIFVVPAIGVAAYIRKEHQMWKETRTKPPSTKNNMRTFRVEDSDPHGYAMNWFLFE